MVSVGVGTAIGVSVLVGVALGSEVGDVVGVGRAVVGLRTAVPVSGAVVGLATTVPVNRAVVGPRTAVLPGSFVGDWLDTSVAAAASGVPVVVRVSADVGAAGYTPVIEHPEVPKRAIMPKKVTTT